MASSEIIPLFPLGVVLLPGTSLPLHIFEDRYRRMVKDCIRHNREFGVVYYNGIALRKNGCTARMIDVINTFDDGTIDILTSGVRRFEILGIREGEPYLEAEVRFFQDRDEDPIALREHSDLTLGLLEELSEMAGKRFDSEAMSRLSPTALSFVLSNTDLLSVAERQEALESRTCQKRLEHLSASARRSIERLRAASRVQKVLGINSDITHLFN